MTIEYYTKNVYGRDVLYMVDGTIAKSFHTMTGRKTLNADDIDFLGKLGIETKRVLEPVNKCGHAGCGRDVCRDDIPY